MTNYNIISDDETFTIASNIITNMKSSGYPSRSGHIDTQQIRIPNYPADLDIPSDLDIQQIWISIRSGYQHIRES